MDPLLLAKEIPDVTEKVEFEKEVVDGGVITKDDVDMKTVVEVDPPSREVGLKTCMQKLAYSIRNKQYILENTQPKPIEYIPQLYVKLKHWNPPPATNQIEDQLTNFSKLMERAINHSTNKHKNIPYNLTHNQETILRELKANKDFIILPTDKNLGPAIINRADYINQAINEHLLTPDYENLNPTTAHNKLTETRDLLIQTYNTHKHSLTEAEIQYFSRSFK
jgi:hypothetical protein